MIEWSYYPVLAEDYYVHDTTTLSAFPLTADDLEKLPWETAIKHVILYNRKVRDGLGVAGTVPKGMQFWQPYANDPPLDF